MILATMPVEWVEWCLKERGRILLGRFGHFCNDWDGLTMDENCDEWATCTCSLQGREAVGLEKVRGDRERS